MSDPNPTQALMLTVAAIALLAAVVLRIDRAERARLAAEERAHRFWACATGVAVLWHFDGGAVGGIHLIGATVACALLGGRAAVLALAVGIAIRHVGDGLPWTGWAPAFLWGALPPVLIAAAVLRLARRAGPRFGPMPVIAASFVAGGASMGVAVALQGWLGGTPAAAGGGGLAALALAMSVAEANLSAAVLVPVAACRPEWLHAGTGERRTG